MITYGQFKELYDAIGGEPEFPLCFEGRPDDEYMIIKYDDGPTFQKCFDGGYLGDREKKFASLNALYHATMPDGICLEKDWGRLKTIMLGDAFYLDNPEELQDCWDLYVPLTAKWKNS